MAIIGFLHKIVWGGKLFVTEEWSCSLHFLSPDSHNINGNLLNSAISEWFLRSGSTLHNACTLDYVKANEIIPSTGLYVNGSNPNTFFFEPPTMGGGTPGVAQNSVAVSTFTALARGRASKGRFYPPSGSSLGLKPDGHVGDTTAAAMAVSAGQLVTDINGAASGSCVVFSKVGQLAEEILGVRVGNTVDTQQRRRRNLVETYVRQLVS